MFAKISHKLKNNFADSKKNQTKSISIW